MTQRRDLGIGRVVASRAGLVGVPAGFGAGGCLCYVHRQIMAQRNNFAGLRLVATGAGPGINALFRTGWRFGRFPFTPVVA